MKRALAAAMAALVLWSGVAVAIPLIVYRHNSPPTYNEMDESGLVNSQRSLAESVISIFRSMGLREGVDYDLMSAQSLDAKTEFFRRGVVTYDFGSPSAYTKSYDAIIHVGLATATSGKGYRPDSLISRQNTNTYNRVPQVFLMYGPWTQSCACSTGYGGDVTYFGTLGQVNFSAKDQSLRYRTAVNTQGILGGGGGTSVWTTSVRVLVGARGGAAQFANQGADGIGGEPRVPSVWPDSLWDAGGVPAGAATDTAVVWAKYWDNLTDLGYDAKPAVFAQSNDYAATATSIPTMMVALAWVDSLTDGGVFGHGVMRGAINIRGGFSRGGQLGWPTSTGGMTNTDSTNFKATLDSLATLGVPMTLAANVDSVASYPNEKSWWSRISTLSYAPWLPTGLLDSTSAGNQATSRYKLVDVYGLRRTRVAIGATSNPADTSIATTLRLAFARTDSIWPNRVDRSVIAPLDDWSPRNLTSMGDDSLMWAFRLAGARAVVTNRTIAFAQNGKPHTTLQGAAWRNGWHRLANMPGESFKILGTATLDSGSVRFDNGTGSVGEAGGFRTFTFLEQWWRGFIGQRNDPTYVVSGPTSGHDSTYFRTPVLTVYASDLQSGTRADASTLPLRPGFHLIKEIVNGSKVVNSFARPRHPLIVWGKVEDVTP